MPKFRNESCFAKMTDRQCQEEFKLPRNLCVSLHDFLMEKAEEYMKSGKNNAESAILENARKVCSGGAYEDYRELLFKNKEVDMKRYKVTAASVQDFDVAAQDAIYVERNYGLYCAAEKLLHVISREIRKKHKIASIPQMALFPVLAYLTFTPFLAKNGGGKVAGVKATPDLLRKLLEGIYDGYKFHEFSGFQLWRRVQHVEDFCRAASYETRDESRWNEQRAERRVSMIFGEKFPVSKLPKRILGIERRIANRAFLLGNCALAPWMGEEYVGIDDGKPCYVSPPISSSSQAADSLLDVPFEALSEYMNEKFGVKLDDVTIEDAALFLDKTSHQVYSEYGRRSVPSSQAQDGHKAGCKGRPASQNGCVKISVKWTDKQTGREMREIVYIKRHDILNPVLSSGERVPGIIYRDFDNAFGGCVRGVDSEIILGKRVSQMGPLIGNYIGKSQSLHSFSMVSREVKNPKGVSYAGVSVYALSGFLHAKKMMMYFFSELLSDKFVDIKEIMFANPVVFKATMRAILSAMVEEYLHQYAGHPKPDLGGVPEILRPVMPRAVEMMHVGFLNPTKEPSGMKIAADLVDSKLSDADCADLIPFTQIEKFINRDKLVDVVASFGALQSVVGLFDIGPENVKITQKDGRFYDLVMMDANAIPGPSIVESACLGPVLSTSQSLTPGSSNLIRYTLLPEWGEVLKTLPADLAYKMGKKMFDLWGPCRKIRETIDGSTRDLTKKEDQVYASCTDNPDYKNCLALRRAGKKWFASADEVRDSNATSMMYSVFNTLRLRPESKSHTGLLQGMRAEVFPRLFSPGNGDSKWVYKCFLNARASNPSHGDSDIRAGYYTDNPVLWDKLVYDLDVINEQGACGMPERYRFSRLASVGIASKIMTGLAKSLMDKVGKGESSREGGMEFVGPLSGYLEGWKVACGNGGECRELQQMTRLIKEMVTLYPQVMCKTGANQEQRERVKNAQRIMDIAKEFSEIKFQNIKLTNKNAPDCDHGASVSICNDDRNLSETDRRSVTNILHHGTIRDNPNAKIEDLERQVADLERQVADLKKQRGREYEIAKSALNELKVDLRSAKHVRLQPSISVSVSGTILRMALVNLSVNYAAQNIRSERGNLAVDGPQDWIRAFKDAGFSKSLPSPEADAGLSPPKFKYLPQVLQKELESLTSLLDESEDVQRNNDFDRRSCDLQEAFFVWSCVNLRSLEFLNSSIRYWSQSEKQENCSDADSELDPSGIVMPCSFEDLSARFQKIVNKVRQNAQKMEEESVGRVRGNYDNFCKMHIKRKEAKESHPRERGEATDARYSGGIEGWTGSLDKKGGSISKKPLPKKKELVYKRRALPETEGLVGRKKEKDKRRGQSGGLIRSFLSACKKNGLQNAKQSVTDWSELKSYRDHAGNDLLISAILQQNNGVVDMLLEEGDIDLSVQNVVGYSALMIAVHRADSGLVESLLRSGADVDMKHSFWVDKAALGGGDHAGAGQKQKVGEWTVLMEASVLGVSGLHGLIGALIKAGANLDARNEMGQTAIMLAVSKGHFGRASKLIKAGARVDIADLDGETALHYVLSRDLGGEDLVKIVTAMLNRGADVNAKNNTGRTPWELAIRFGGSGVVRQMILRGQSPNVFLSGGLTPLAASVVAGDWDLAHLLVESNAVLNFAPKIGEYQGMTPLMLAIRASASKSGRIVDAGLLQLIRRLVEKGARLDEPDGSGEKLLEFAQSEGAPSEVLTCLRDVNTKIARDIQGLHPVDNEEKDMQEPDRVANKEKDRREPPSVGSESGAGMHEARKARRSRRVARKVGGDRSSVLAVAIQGGVLSLKEFLRGEGNVKAVRKLVNTPIMGLSPLSCAILHEDAESVKLLLSAGAEVNSVNLDTSTPLMLAAETGRWDIAEPLISGGADLSPVNRYGQGVLFYATWGGNLDIVRYLVNDKEIDPDVLDLRNSTPLMFAALDNRDSIVQFLIERNCKVDRCGPRGNTAIHYAAHGNSPFALRELLMRQGRKGLDIRNENSQTPYDVAEQGRHKDVVEFIAAYKTHTATDPRVVENGKLKNGPKKLLRNNAVAPIAASGQNAGGASGYFDRKTEHNAEVVHRGVTLQDRQEDLWRAVEHKDARKVLQIIRSGGVDPNKLGPSRYSGFSPVVRAIELNDVDVLKVFLDNNVVDFHATYSYSKNTLLMMAAEYGSTEAMDLLVKYDGVNVNATNNQGRTALFFVKGAKEVERLVSFGAKVDVADKEGNTPLTNAILLPGNNGGADVFEALVRQGADVNFYKKPHLIPLLSACSNENRHVLHKMLKLDELSLDVCDRDGDCVLHHLACWDKTDIAFDFFKRVLERCPQLLNRPNLLGCTPLLEALRIGSMPYAKLVFDTGVCSKLDVKVTDKNGRNAVMLAIIGVTRGPIRFRTEDVDRILFNCIDLGIDLNAKDSEGKTALYYAVESGEIPLVERLVGSGAELTTDVLNFVFGHGVNPAVLTELLKAQCALGAMKEVGPDPQFDSKVQGVDALRKIYEERYSSNFPRAFKGTVRPPNDVGAKNALQAAVDNGDTHKALSLATKEKSPLKLLLRDEEVGYFSTKLPHYILQYQKFGGYDLGTSQRLALDMCICVSEFGDKALHVAVASGRDDLVKQLRMCNPDLLGVCVDVTSKEPVSEIVPFVPSTGNDCLWTPLHVAVYGLIGRLDEKQPGQYEKYLKVVKALLSDCEVSQNNVTSKGTGELESGVTPLDFLIEPGGLNTLTKDEFVGVMDCMLCGGIGVARYPKKILDLCRVYGYFVGKEGQEGFRAFVRFANCSLGEICTDSKARSEFGKMAGELLDYVDGDSSLLRPLAKIAQQTKISTPASEVDLSGRRFRPKNENEKGLRREGRGIGRDIDRGGDLRNRSGMNASVSQQGSSELNSSQNTQNSNNLTPRFPEGSGDRSLIMGSLSSLKSPDGGMSSRYSGAHARDSRKIDGKGKSNDRASNDVKKRNGTAKKAGDASQRRV